MDFDKIRTDINSILDDGDKVKASAKILDLQDYVTKEEAETVSKFNQLNETIEKQNATIKQLQEDNDSIRAANFDVMQKYGDLVRQTTPVLKAVDKKEDEDTNKSQSWEEIMKME